MRKKVILKENFNLDVNIQCKYFIPHLVSTSNFLMKNGEILINKEKGQYYHIYESEFDLLQEYKEILFPYLIYPNKYGELFRLWELSYEEGMKMLNHQRHEEISNSHYLLNSGGVLELEDDIFFLHSSIKAYHNLNNNPSLTLDSGVNHFGQNFLIKKEVIISKLKSALEKPILDFSELSIKQLDCILEINNESLSYENYYRYILSIIAYTGEVYIKHYGGAWNVVFENDCHVIYILDHNGKDTFLSSFLVKKLHPSFKESTVSEIYNSILASRNFRSSLNTSTDD
ncbi:hypothetical protein V6R21_12235 [Limibacter armeniacum]|uniref:hypothetical protein n=1 Tax=Limibacter armeniacum TaxID=466084 RepID=UPI002FE559F1